MITEGCSASQGKRVARAVLYVSLGDQTKNPYAAHARPFLRAAHEHLDHSTRLG